jgi:hypothetical protein
MGDQPLTASSSGNTTFYLYGFGAFGEKTNAWSYSLPDGTNTPRQLTSATGAVTLAGRYMPWGDILEVHGAGSFTFGYLGGMMDLASGLIYVGNGQYYDPSSGRFLTRGVNPDGTNPYVPWNPLGAIVGPLSLFSLIAIRKRGKHSKGYLLMLFILIVLPLSIGMACEGEGGVTPTEPVNLTVTVTLPDGTTVSGQITATPGAPSTPLAIPCPTPTPLLLPKVTIFFGGSWDQSRINEPGPDPAFQTNAWHQIANESIPYPGNKQEHARSVNISAYANSDLVVIGYSAGADSALIFAYAYWEEQQKQGFPGRITGIAILGGTMTGPLVNGGNLEERWPDILNTLILWGTDVYVLNDSTRTSSQVAGYSAPSAQNAGRFWYDDQPQQEHWSGPWSTEISYLNNGTNNSPSYRDKVLDWLGSN